MEELQDVVSYREAAEMLGITPLSVKQLVKRGHLRSVALPGTDQRMRFLVRSQVEDRKVHARAAYSSEHYRKLQRLIWQCERSLAQLRDAL